MGEKHEEGNPKSCCCISHEFYNSASRNPDKIAVIHAIGGARLARERLRNRSRHNQAHHHHYSHPPVFDGDHCFTYSHLLTAVDALSFRLRNIFNGGDDPFLVRPNSGNDQRQYRDQSQIYTSHDIIQGQSHDFHNNGIPKIVGVYMAPSVDYIVAVLSILRSGHAFLPLDSALPRERLLSFLSSSDIALIIGQNDSDDKGTDYQHTGSFWDMASCSWPLLRISMDVLLTDKRDHLHSYFSCGSQHLRRFDYVLYTSGSTGNPKGICGTEQGQLNRFIWMKELYPFHDEEILMFKTTMSFVDHLQEFLAAMLSGCTLIVPPSSVLKSNVLSLVALLQDYNVSRFIAVPSLMRTLLPALQNPNATQIRYSLRLLVLSGEVFPITLWHTLSRLLPKTVILNLYGSAEVSGDCTFFDCKRLPALLESEILTTVPIGVSISNCNVVLFKDGTSVEGEICVNGVCLSRGYLSTGQLSPFDYVELPVDPLCVDRCGNKFFRTGDFARELLSGDLVFIGRKDRTVKVNGQRVALEEIEDTLRGHPNVADAAVILHKNQWMHAFLGAYLVIEDKPIPAEVLTSVKTWVVDKLPAAMIPRILSCIDAIPTTSTGKVDYALLSGSASLRNDETHYLAQTELLEHIEEVFSDALAVAEVGSDDDFFMLGGDSILAAEVANRLGINMSLMYMYPRPSLLEKALLRNEGGSIVDRPVDHATEPITDSGGTFDPFTSRTFEHVQEVSQIIGSKNDKSFLRDYNTKDLKWSKRLKVNQCRDFYMKDLISLDLYPWRSKSSFKLCALSRCNRVMFAEISMVNELWWQMWEIRLSRSSWGLLRDLWKVQMISCVDASPVIAFKEKEILLFIGSHSNKFFCIDAQSGFVRWEKKLAGRIECSASIDGDFSQVVVGCYEGRIYFLDFFTGNICWSFQTSGEVKSQPVVDKQRHLIWCGSHDHNLYGLDYRNHCCVYQYACRGSVFSSPIIDEGHDVLYVATTNGQLTAILLKDLSFSVLWLLELEAPIFGSLASSSAGNVICCLVNGNVVTLDYKGSVVWRVSVGGPIFSGACISNALPSQGLVCSRDGNVYSLELGDGSLLWKYNVGIPITASAYVDEELKLTSDSPLPSDSDRFVCICSSSGRIVLLRVGEASSEDSNQPQRHWVEKFAESDLEGDIFSSPVMVGGRIFVGCRDDYLHCVVVEGQLYAKNHSGL